jgi:hypothetical protein
LFCFVLFCCVVFLLFVFHDLFRLTFSDAPFEQHNNRTKTYEKPADSTPTPPPWQHVSLAFKMMQEDPDIDVLSGFEPSAAIEMRESIIFMVLGTDMAHHFDHLGQFQAQIMNTTADMSDVSVRRKMLRMCVHCADVSNPAKNFHVYEKWAHLVMEEFYQQGDKERHLGMTISPFMDRTNPQVAKCQLGFIKFIVRPLYVAFCELVTSLKDEITSNLDKNVVEWERQKKLGAESPVLRPHPSLRPIPNVGEILEQVEENEEDEEDEEDE